jgi:hypothetical protein
MVKNAFENIEKISNIASIYYIETSLNGVFFMLIVSRYKIKAA